MTRVLPEDIALRAAALAFGVQIADMLSPRRWRELVDARATVMWLLRDEGYTYPRIARVFGMDHTTVIHSVKRLKADTDERFTELVNIAYHEFKKGTGNEHYRTIQS